MQANVNGIALRIAYGSPNKRKATALRPGTPITYLHHPSSNPSPCPYQIPYSNSAISRRLHLSFPFKSQPSYVGRNTGHALKLSNTGTWCGLWSISTTHVSASFLTPPYAQPPHRFLSRLMPLILYSGCVCANSEGYAAYTRHYHNPTHPRPSA